MRPGGGARAVEGQALVPLSLCTRLPDAFEFGKYRMIRRLIEQTAFEDENPDRRAKKLACDCEARRSSAHDDQISLEQRARFKSRKVFDLHSGTPQLVALWVTALLVKRKSSEVVVAYHYCRLNCLCSGFEA